MRTRLLLKAIICKLRKLLKVQCLQITKRRGRRPQAKELLMLVSVVRARDDAISHLSEKMILFIYCLIQLTALTPPPSFLSVVMRIDYEHDCRVFSW